jgi:hypothetical protein
VYDALQTPFGMVRFGVAPDHPKIKSVTRVYEKTARHPGFRFFGGVRLGEHVTRAELLERYHAVVYAYGTVTDNRLGIPGEGRPGSHSATDNRRARVATSRLPPPYAAHTETTFAQLCPQTNTPYSHPLGRIRAAVDTRRVTEHDSCESGRLARPRTRASGRTSWKRPRRDPADARPSRRCGSGQGASRGARSSSQAGAWETPIRRSSAAASRWNSSPAISFGLAPRTGCARSRSRERRRDRR